MMEKVFAALDQIPERQAYVFSRRLHEIMLWGDSPPAQRVNWQQATARMDRLMGEGEVARLIRRYPT